MTCRLALRTLGDAGAKAWLERDPAVSALRSLRWPRPVVVDVRWHLDGADGATKVTGPTRTVRMNPDGHLSGLRCGLGLRTTRSDLCAGVPLEGLRPRRTHRSDRCSTGSSRRT